MTQIATKRIAAIARYDFAVDGGAISTIALRGDKIPAGAIILDVTLDVLTVLTGASAAVALQAESADDLQTSAAVSGAPFSTATPKRGTLNATAAPVKTTVDRAVSAVISGGAVTAGKFNVLVLYTLLPS